jgi:4-amino-4-deoxychorismate lyase
MYLLFETIQILDGAVQDIAYHNDRFNRSREILFGVNQIVFLEEFIKIPAEYSSGVVKCKVVYDESIKGISFSRYVPKPVNRLILIECNNIDYGYKYSDRSKLDDLLQQADCLYDEDILIIKNGLVTDTSYSNVAFFDGSEWITPAAPLLAGTKRAKLLDQRAIKTGEIAASEIKYFEKIKLFNAMLTFDYCPPLPITSIY